MMPVVYDVLNPNLLAAGIAIEGREESILTQRKNRVFGRAGVLIRLPER